jgi:hypothetical protein
VLLEVIELFHLAPRRILMSLRLVIPVVTLSLLGCGSDAGPGTAPLRPGIEDSSRSYKGTPSAAESAFWVAVRSGDDAARGEAVNKMRADAERDPATYGYSAFLSGANSFIPSTAVLRAQASGAMQPQPQPPTPELSEAARLFTQGMQNLTDPLYLGFDAALLATLQLSGGDVAAGQETFAFGMQKNPAASGFISVIFKLQQQDVPGALEAYHQLIEYCYGGPVDHDGADAGAFLARANAATLAHRECYSGYHAPHGTEGLLLLGGDLHALNGKAESAGHYYAAVQAASNYSTWPLKPLLERRIDGTEPPSIAADLGLTGCGSCHTNALP